ncbi:uncharacterized protein LOC113320472 [Papaver somniferum]|uniref:uncharacterized protein LOC113320472 n=1 Tax=Papaver somniferum TaxID=3469 RepID=UPI000E6FF8A9|nr:uncharacterized protein LOC113320472 [Papaver somniferum]
MAIEETRVRLNHLKISEVSTKAIPITTEEEQSTEVVVPTKIEEAGRKYCCANCYRSYGRVTHVALEWRVTLEPIAVVSGGRGREHQPYYTCRFPGINSHRVEAGMLDHSVFIRKFNTVCNFCGEIVGWHLTAKSDYMPDNAVYWCDTLMDREKVVLLDEEENEIARDCNVDSEIPSINYMKEKKAKKVLPLRKAFKRQHQFLALGTAQVLAQGRAVNRARQVLAQGTAIKPAPRNLKWDYFA